MPQRLYRDARIFSIYEGTTQLQVVAAVRYITNGTYLGIMKDMSEKLRMKSEESAAAPGNSSFFTHHSSLLERIARLIDLYEKAVAYVNEQNNQEVHDFLARRLYDMTCEIIMSLLIIDDASRAPELFEKSANVYVRMTEEDVCAKSYYVMHFTEADLPAFRAE